MEMVKMDILILNGKNVNRLILANVLPPNIMVLEQQMNKRN